jgi:hypothetical protein
MLAKLEALAELSVARACGFAAIGILTFMVGLADRMTLSLKVGGLMGLVLCLILVLRGMTALRRPYKSTEVWIMMRPGDRPQASIAQRVIGHALRWAYYRFALNAACVSAGFLAASLVLTLFGPAHV